MTTVSQNTLKGLFSVEQSRGAASSSTQLGATAQLTTLSMEIANNILKTIDTDVEKFQPMVVESQKSHDAMDKLIAESYDLQAVSIDFLKAESNDVLEKMVRSQQSKRSRSKGKVMTLDNYTTMLVGAIAENLLRIAIGKPKSNGGGTYNLTDVGYSDDELQELANDEEKLKKAIRNVQSKKSIMKSKADYDETSERWQQLLKVEETLKSLRTGGDPSEIKKAVETTQKLEELLATADVQNLKATDAKSMLEAIKEILATK